jgi:hypothetical protein
MTDDNFDQYVKSIDKLSSLSRREILIRLGDAVLTQESIGLSAPTVKQSRDAAKKYLVENYHQMKSIICENKNKIASKESHAAAAILDVLIAHVGGLPAVFAALLIADYTVDKFCASTIDGFIGNLDHGQL